jgi:hypothetical protein
VARVWFLLTADGDSFSLLTLGLSFPQVLLEVLADPSHPQLAAKLRFVGANVTRQPHQELRDWLDDGLFMRLMDVLRALPTLGLSDHKAAEVCAAAVAAACNIIQTSRAFKALELPAAGSPATTASLRKQASCPHVRSALVRYDILNPAAAEPLPPGHEVHMMVNLSGSVPASVFAQPSCSTRISRGYWVPWKVCAYSISERVYVADNTLNGDAKAALAAAVDGVTFQKLLTSAMDHPCGGPPPAAHTRYLADSGGLTDRLTDCPARNSLVLDLGGREQCAASLGGPRAGRWSVPH